MTGTWIPPMVECPECLKNPKQGIWVVRPIGQQLTCQTHGVQKVTYEMRAKAIRQKYERRPKKT